MLEGSYSSRPPRIQVQSATARVTPAGGRRLRFAGAPDADADQILDINTKGLKLHCRGEAPELESLIDIDLRHPHLRGPIRLQGRVKWVRTDEGTHKVGVRFEMLRDTTRVALMQLVVLELGRSVYGSNGSLGYVSVVEGEPKRYTAYNLRRELLGSVVATTAGYRAEPSEGDPSREFVTLKEALSVLFGQPAQRIVPPIR
jgi:hypothetical protein